MISRQDPRFALILTLPEWILKIKINWTDVEEEFS